MCATLRESLLAEDRVRGLLQMCAQGQLVRLGSADTEETSFFTCQTGDAVLEGFCSVVISVVGGSVLLLSVTASGAKGDMPLYDL